MKLERSIIILFGLVLAIGHISTINAAEQPAPASNSIIQSLPAAPPPPSTGDKVAPQNPQANQQSKAGNGSALPAANSVQPVAAPKITRADVDKMNSTAKENIPTPRVDDKLIIIGSGNVSGVYYPTSGAICRLFNSARQAGGSRCAVEATEGSVYNIESLRSGEVEFGMVQSDVQRQALESTDAFQGMPRFDALRFMFSLHNEALTIVVKKTAKINALDDLVGKVINIGSKGSSVRSIMETLMRLKGWNIQTFKGVTEYPAEKQVDSLCKDEIDAMILVSGHPSGAMQSVSSACEVKILELVGSDIEKFVQDNPEYSFESIPGGMYLGIAKNIRTIGTKATLVTTNEMSEEVVYQVTKAVFSQLDKFRKMYPVLSNLEAKPMVQEGQTVPMHPGSKRYFVEAGLMK